MSQVLEFERVDRPTAEDRPADPGADRRLAITVIVTGLVSLFGIDALEPAPHHADSSWVWVAEIGTTVFFAFACVGAYALLNGRPRLGYLGLMSAAWVQVALVMGCPLSGHHRFGGWWAGQMAIALAFATISSVAYGIMRSRPAPHPTDA